MQSTPNNTYFLSEIVGVFIIVIIYDLFGCICNILVFAFYLSNLFHSLFFFLLCASIWIIWFFSHSMFFSTQLEIIYTLPNFLSGLSTYSFFKIFKFFIPFLKVTCHLQLLQNIGYIPHTTHILNKV